MASSDQQSLLSTPKTLSSQRIASLSPGQPSGGLNQLLTQKNGVEQSTASAEQCRIFRQVYLLGQEITNFADWYFASVHPGNTLSNFAIWSERTSTETAKPQGAVDMVSGKTSWFSKTIGKHDFTIPRTNLLKKMKSNLRYFLLQVDKLSATVKAKPIIEGHSVNQSVLSTAPSGTASITGALVDDRYDSSLLIQILEQLLPLLLSLFNDIHHIDLVSTQRYEALMHSFVKEQQLRAEQKLLFATRSAHASAQEAYANEQSRLTQEQLAQRVSALEAEREEWREGAEQAAARQAQLSSSIDELTATLAERDSALAAARERIAALERDAAAAADAAQVQTASLTAAEARLKKAQDDHAAEALRASSLAEQLAHEQAQRRQAEAAQAAQAGEAAALAAALDRARADDAVLAALRRRCAELGGAEAEQAQTAAALATAQQALVAASQEEQQLRIAVSRAQEAAVAARAAADAAEERRRAAEAEARRAWRCRDEAAEAAAADAAARREAEDARLAAAEALATAQADATAQQKQTEIQAAQLREEEARRLAAEARAEKAEADARQQRFDAALAADAAARAEAEAKQAKRERDEWERRWRDGQRKAPALGRDEARQASGRERAARLSRGDASGGGRGESGSAGERIAQPSTFASLQLPPSFSTSSSFPSSSSFSFANPSYSAQPPSRPVFSQTLPSSHFPVSSQPQQPPPNQLQPHISPVYRSSTMSSSSPSTHFLPTASTPPFRQRLDQPQSHSARLPTAQMAVEGREDEWGEEEEEEEDESGDAC